ncbi:MAG: RDD family protein, partial [Bifidobacteriaceae bacterium]|nr:RDD family protein [Bifidobacteriaceae bacterium]
METDQIITGEAVALEVRPASFALRMCGAAIDLVALGVAAVMLLRLLAWAGLPNLDPAAGRAAVIALIVFVTVVVPTLVETLWRGRSPGKLAAGYRIVRDDGGPVRLRQALARAVVGLFELWLTGGSVALIASMVGSKGKRLGDFLAGTYAARVRGVKAVIVPVAMPPELAAWAGAADMARLPDGLALRARQFLGRLATLSPAMRLQVGMALAAEVEAFVAPPPPPRTHPER